MTQPASTAQIRKIHALARDLRIDEDTRRALMERETGKTSSKQLDIVEAKKVIDAMGRSAPAVAAPKAKGALILDGTFVPKIRALWISGHMLGVVREKTDRSMVAFVLRQTGVMSERWASKTLEDPAAARKVIEALKKWLERDAGVVWKDEDPDGEGAKRAVYLAIRRQLTAAGEDLHFREFPGRTFAPKNSRELEELTRRAAERLRGAAHHRL